jgi:hypothetical protein
MGKIQRWDDDGNLIWVDESTGEEVGVPTGKPFQWKKNLDSGMGIFGMTKEGLGTDVLSWWQKELQKNRESGEQGPFKFGGGWWGNFGERRDERRAERAERRESARDVRDVRRKKDIREIQESEGGDWKNTLDEDSFLSYAIKNMKEPKIDSQPNENFMVPFFNSAGAGGIEY